MTEILRPISAVALGFLEIIRFIGDLCYLLLDAVVGIPRSLFSKQGRRLGWESLWEQMDRVGVRSIRIVCLVLFCIGITLALKMAPTLKEYGAVERVPDIISIAIAPELGPLVSAIVLTGFAGASIAAELGAMVVSEEIEALEAHAINPIRFLVVPRVIATTVMMVCIAVIGDIAGFFGGYTMGMLGLGISSHMYIQHSFDVLHKPEFTTGIAVAGVFRDFLTGLVKAGIFGMLISGIACRLGLSVTGGATGVGIATTKTVVYTIVSLIIVDLICNFIIFKIGW